MAREGAPPSVIQRQIGHSNLGTTSIYLHRQHRDSSDIVHACLAPDGPRRRYASPARASAAAARPNRQSTVRREPAAGEDERAPCTASTNLQAARTGGDDRRHRARPRPEPRYASYRERGVPPEAKNGWPTLSRSGRLAKSPGKP